MRRYSSNFLANFKHFAPIIESICSVPKLEPLQASSKSGKFQILIPPNSWVASVRPFCSKLDSIDRTHDLNSGFGAVEVKGLDSEKLYNAVMENCHPHLDMETALDHVGANLSTQLVLEVLRRLRFEERLAFRFFTWVTHQESFTHEACVYNDMINILSSTRYKVREFGVVCDVLDYMKRNSGKRAVPLDDLLEILRKYADKHLTHLQKYVPPVKRSRFKRPVEIDGLNVLLDALCKCGLVDYAETLFEKVKRSKVRPDASCYNTLFLGWCRVRNPGKGMRVLEEMIEMGHTPYHLTYSTAIISFCEAGMITEAINFFEFMRTKGSVFSSPTARSYAAMIVALIHNDKIEESFKLLDDMINSGCLPDVSTYNDMIEGMCTAGKLEEAYMFLEKMGNKGFPPDIVTFNCFLKVLCANKNSEEALRLYSRMIEVGCAPSVQTFNMLISMFFEMCDPDGAFETWHEMGKRGCAPDIDTYCTMIEGLFGCNKTEDARLLLDDVMKLGMKLPYQKFDLFLMQLSEVGDLQTIYRLSKHMKQFFNPTMAKRFALSERRNRLRLREK